MKPTTLLWGIVSAAIALSTLSSCNTTNRVRNYFDSVKKAPVKPSYIVVESNSGRVLYSYNANVRREIGMLTNMVTAAVIADWLSARNVDPCTMMTVPVDVSYWNQSGTNLLQLQPGDRISVRDALYSALLTDDSASAITLAHHCGSSINANNPISAFVTQANQLAKQLGMKNTYFEAAHGATASRSTARDIAVLTMYLQQKPAIQLISSQATSSCTIISNSGVTRQVPIRNSNQLIGQNHDVDGLKATKTHDAGACLITTVRRPSVKRPDPKTGAETIYPQNMTIVILGMQDQYTYKAASSFMKDGWSIWEDWRKTYDLTETNKFVTLPKSL